ncbi:bridge-like lipid transfer protein family member 1 [Tubulanus polymorphus]|uniref:bridge-like lipid transfer protein family member 1 n=1 Tax=Tubulanus polymorphus TaxID=672921 RepID=UPI003DA41F33
MLLARNGSIFDKIQEELPGSTVYWMLIALVVSMGWVVYITYYNSRILGLILTALLNKFMKNYGHFQFGSFSFSVLSGKIMFRDVHYITEDYSIKVMDGWIIFRWWRPYIYKEDGADMSHSETRLSILFDGFEIHVYNRSESYAKIERLFGLDQLMTPQKEQREDSEVSEESNETPAAKGYRWRDLVPVIKVDITAGRLVFGNFLLPTTLCISFADAHMMYTTKPASTPFDLFMHYVECNAENLRVMLVPSPKFQGVADEPPRYMGQGFVVLQSQDVVIFYRQDEPGIVPHEPESLQLVDGDVVVRPTFPHWGMDIRCGKGTDISYGPWVDKQREYLWKFFFPADYQQMDPTKIPEPGETRIFKSFEFSLNLLSQGTIDILFTKNKETQAIHMTTSAGSHVEVTVPWLITETGFTSHIFGQLLYVDATTSLPYRSLIDSEILEFDINITYPLLWNDYQNWQCEFTACRSSVCLIYEHKHFIMSLFDDWGGKTKQDIYHFVPYTMHFNLLIKEFELITVANEFNWIDCSSQHEENAHIAICADTFELSLLLPFTDYLPPKVPVKFFIRAESAEALIYLPQTNTSRHILMALAQNMKLVDRDGNVVDQPFSDDRRWRNKTSEISHGWIPVWTTPIVAIGINYSYHPSPIIEEPTPIYRDFDDITTPEREDQLLIPLKPAKERPPPVSQIPDNFDPTTLEADVIKLDLEVGPSTVIAYGTLVCMFLHLKEDYFGEHQKFTPFDEAPSGLDKRSDKESHDKEAKKFDARHYRPLEVNGNITIHDIQGHLVKNCGADDTPCPTIYLERLGFEIDKRYYETKLQVLLSPLIVHVKDYLERPESQNHLNEGYLALSGLQVRGHAMFSHEGLPLDSETIEYGWLIEVIVGDIVGKLTSSQLLDVAQCLQMFVFLVEDIENQLQNPISYKLCQHMIPQPECNKLPEYSVECPTVDELKYRLTRVSVDNIDVCLVEAGSSLCLQIYPIRLSMCNLHGTNNKAGITALIQNIFLRQFIMSTAYDSEQPESWLESGGLCLGPINVDSAMALPSPEYHKNQDQFLKLHDQKSHRLFFLWPPDLSKMQAAVIGKCGCLGGCKFFGNNTNGLRFFQPSKNDAYEGTNTAVFRIQPAGVDLGFGQSLLNKNQLVFDVGSYYEAGTPESKSFNFTRGYMSRVSPATPTTNTSLMEELAYLAKRQTSITETAGSDSSTIRSERSSRVSDDLFNRSKGSTLDSEATLVDQDNAETGSMKDFIPLEETMPDVYDTNSPTSSSDNVAVSSASSIPELPVTWSNRTSRKSIDVPPSYDRPATVHVSGPYSQQSSPTPMHKLDSVSSLSTQYSSAQSMQVVARSASRQSIQQTSPSMSHAAHSLLSRVGSTESYAESDRFYSAEEELGTPTPLSDSESMKALIRQQSTSTIEEEEQDYVLTKLAETSYSTTTSETSMNTAVLDTTPTNSDLSLNKSPYRRQSSVHRQMSRKQSIGGFSMDSVSTTSFMSAMSSQEDLTLVDLHCQINQPITQSPILMSCYSAHLTQAQVKFWRTKQLMTEQLPRPSFTKVDPNNQRSYAPGVIPLFSNVRNGFTCGQMVVKRDVPEFPDLSTPVSDIVSEPWDHKPDIDDVQIPPDVAVSAEDNVSKTTAVVKLSGSIDALLTPLMLESLQRYIEAASQALTNAHPSAILDKLHIMSSSQVQVQHKLKKEKYIKDSQNETEDKEQEGDQTSRLQVMFSLSKINICVLQSSIVEEVISFSALDNIKDLTCVSVLAFCFDSITCQVLINNRSSKALESPESTPIDSHGIFCIHHSKSAGKKASTRLDADQEKPETQTEEMVGNLHLKRIHCQLRRLTKNSNFSSDVILTAIPEHRSKVLFTFDCQDMAQTPTPTHNMRSDFPDISQSGVIIFECGLEDIDLKAAKRSGYPDPVAEECEKKKSEVLEEIASAQMKQKLSEAKTAKEKEDSATNAQQAAPPTSSTSPYPSSSGAEDVHVQIEKDDEKEASAKSEECEGSVKSRISIPSAEVNCDSDTDTLTDEGLKGDASSCVLEFKMAWFNFASPPRMPNKRKVDFTRLDWNLLSTVTPALNAWMNPSDRLMVALKNLMAANSQRVTAVLACMMTEALEMQGIHMPVRSRYNKTTPFSKALQLDPSCQLFTVLRRYLVKTDLSTIEASVHEDTMPQLVTLQKGIMALTRQWKNVLYMPTQGNFKAKRGLGYTVHFAIPDGDSGEEDDNVSDNFEVIDEKASLIHMKELPLSSSMHSLTEPPAPRPKPLIRQNSAPNLNEGKNTPASQKTTPSKKIRSSIPTVADSPAPGIATTSQHGMLSPLARMQRNESNMSFVSAASVPNLTTPTAEGTPSRQNLAKNLAKLDGKKDDDDLYRWMVKQQEYTQRKMASKASINPSIGQESTMQTILSQYSHDESRDVFFPKYAMAALPLADAQVLFKPLLESIGLHIKGIKSSPLMKNFGGHLSLQGILHSLKIDIVDSDFNSLKKSKSKNKGRPKVPKIQIDASLDAPAFLCENFTVDMSMKDIIDFEKDEEEHKTGMSSRFAFAMDDLEAKPTTTQVVFSVNVYSISQHVNMSLLRLVHQFVTMIDNVKETRIELRHNRTDSDTSTFRGHRKQGSKSSSTGTESQSLKSDTAKTPSMNPTAGTSPRVERSVAASSQSKPARPTLPKDLPLSSRPEQSIATPMKRSPKRFSFRKKWESVGASVKHHQLHHHHHQAHSASQPSTCSPLLTEAVTVDIMNDTSSPALAEKTIVDEIKEITPKCWRTLYHLVELYSTMPETKTVIRKPSMPKLPAISEEPEKVTTGSVAASSSKTSTLPKDHKSMIDEMEMGERKPSTPPIYLRQTGSVPKIGTFTQTIFIGDRIPLVVFGTCKVRRTHISAALSGLKLEAEVSNIHSSATHKEKIKGVSKRKSCESSATAYVGHTMIVLLEGTPPNMQTVVTVNITKSMAVYTSVMKRGKEHNTCFINIGKIDVDIPHHPIVLHGMVTRSSKRLSSTLQEFIRHPPHRQRAMDVTDTSLPLSSMMQEVEEPKITRPKLLVSDKAKPLSIHFKAILQGLTIGASLLPSLRAQYRIAEVTSSGLTGKKAKFTLDFTSHTLSFNSKVSTPEAHLPSSASIDLPPIHLSAHYRLQSTESTKYTDSLSEGLILREGNFFDAVAEVGSFEHSLTTDLLNHLVFVQKVFMKEVNEVVQKVSGGDQPVPIWNDEGKRVNRDSPKPVLYSLHFRFKGIQITATTPTSSAVRLETGVIELDLSNRVQTASNRRHTNSNTLRNSHLKLFGKAQVDLNLALGQLIKNPLFEEAEAEFNIMAFFKTRIGLRNALQDEMIPETAEDQEALLITLHRPIILVQPHAFDKAVLVWLNYKNAYDYWNEQRLALNHEVQTATQEVISKLPFGHSSSATSPIHSEPSPPGEQPSATAAALGTLFLQLTVEDLGICLPLSSFSGMVPSSAKMVDHEHMDPGEALVLTLASTQISACSCGSLVSKGRFTDFCIRFAEDFETTWDDWKPDVGQTMIMNAARVPEGTYEVCSRTTSKQISENGNGASNAKWILNILWHMKGIDVHLDQNIGVRLNLLFNTLTTLAWDPENADVEETEYGPPEKTESHGRKSTIHGESLPGFVYDTRLDYKTRARLIQKEMDEQARVVEDLKQLGASNSTIETETRKLHELENAVFHDFRRDVIKKFQKSRDKATALKDKLGLGYKPASHYRSRSIGHPGQVASIKRKERLVRNRFISVQHYPTYTVDREAENAEVASTMDDVNLADQNSLSESRLNRKRLSLQDILASSTESESEDEIDDEYIKRLTRKKANDAPPKSPDGLSSGSGGSVSQKTILSTEPSVDFELDVKIKVESGSCILHPMKVAKIEDDTATLSSTLSSAKRMNRRDHHHSGGDYTVNGSPTAKRRAKRSGEFSSANTNSTSKLRGQSQPEGSATIKDTVFYLPGVDVKINYNSKTEGVTPTSQSQSSGQNSVFEDPKDANHTNKRIAVKKANLHAWLSLQKLPEEMIIQPSLLDFLEQALEPIEMPQQVAQKTGDRSVIGDIMNVDLEASSTSLSSGAYATSFPVDVVVYISVQPSSIRFNCLPVSKVECLLCLPSLDLVFSTKRVDIEANTLSDGTPPSKAKDDFFNVWRSGSASGGVRDRNSGRSRQSSGGGRSRLTSTGSSADTVVSTGGGLSVTGCLADFSLYIFHPYGGHKKGILGMTPPLSDSPVTSLGGDTGRKDSLSLNVEMVKVNISRSRKGIAPVDATLHASSSSAKLSSLDSATSKLTNIVRFSAVCDVDSASFKYDMRRLPEIMAFPKAWYRRTLARRLFLGEQMNPHAMGDSDDDLSSEESYTSSPSPMTPGSPSRTPFQRAHTTAMVNAIPEESNTAPTHHRRASSGDKVKVKLNLDLKELARTNSHRSTKSYHGQPTISSAPGTPAQKESSAKSSPSPVHQNIPETTKVQSTPSHATKSQSITWETLVLFAVKLSRLDVHVNMGNVMGNTTWVTRDLNTQGRITMSSSGNKNMKMSAGLGGSSVDAKGGIVGGLVDIQKIETYLNVCEGSGKQVDHQAGLELVAIEGRLDYMGSSIMMARMSKLSINLRDEWRMDTSPDRDMPLATKRPAVIFVHGDLEWDKFHLMISRSTTPDLAKMASKLEEFFAQQFDSSRRVLSTIGPIPAAAAARLKNLTKKQDESRSMHHRHWQRVLQRIAGCQLSILDDSLPERGTILGGTLNLRGNNIVLACFHGINFRSKSWALFTMVEPNISFATEAQEIQSVNGTRDSHIVQNLTFHLGHNVTERTRAHNMARVCRLARGHYMPQHFTNVTEWFHYAFSSADIKDLDSFPHFEKPVIDPTSPQERERRTSTRKPTTYNHDTEVIFGLPCLQLHLKTEHLQGEKTPLLTEPKPVIECSFVTEFEDHIAVSMDAEAILFLHDVVTAYLKEKEKGLRYSVTTGVKSVRSPEMDKKGDSPTNLTEDWREYECKTWHLEPTVRLLSWAGNKIDPVGVDYILHKLGFNHARTTIPKWMQRGAMDPCDKVLSVLVEKLIQYLRSQEEDEESTIIAASSSSTH